jgi:hypothetical protein
LRRKIEEKNSNRGDDMGTTVTIFSTLQDSKHHSPTEIETNQNFNDNSFLPLKNDIYMNSYKDEGTYWASVKSEN